MPEPRGRFTGVPVPGRAYGTRRNPWVLITLTLLMFLALNVPGQTKVLAYSVLTPSGERLLVNTRRATTHMIIQAASESERRKIMVQKSLAEDRNQEISPLGYWQENGIYYIHFLLPLKKGTNTFLVKPGNRQIRIRYRPLRTLLNIDFEKSKAYLFHRRVPVPRVCAKCHKNQLAKNAGLNIPSQAKRSQDYSPSCYSCHRQLLTSSPWKHGPAANLQCMGCHSGTKGPGQITILTGKVTKNCLECHVNSREWENMSHIHGPVGVGDCTVCHDPHGSEFRYQLWADGNGKLCVACHRDKKKLVGQSPPGFHLHGVIPGAGCTICHSPHASENRYQLVRPIEKLCVECHQSMKGIIVGHPVRGHPIRGKKDPRRKGRTLSCTSCHSPHGSDYTYLLIGDLLGGHVCSMCHH